MYKFPFELTKLINLIVIRHSNLKAPVVPNHLIPINIFIFSLLNVKRPSTDVKIAFIVFPYSIVNDDMKIVNPISIKTHF